MKEAATSSPTILIVDDNRNNIILLRKILAQENYNFMIAFNGEEALTRIAYKIPDLIIMDVQMPVMDGFEVCRKIKADPKIKDIPVIFVSALSSSDDKIKGFEAGGDDYISKPLYPKEVIVRLRLNLQKRQTIRNLKQFLKRSYHELYNPLSIITTSAELYNLTFSKNRYVDSMHAAAKSLHVIYQDLYYALNPKKKIHCLEPIDMASFIRNRIDYFALLAEVKGNMITFIENENFKIVMDRTALERIVDNTLSNAIKYSNENTTIAIKLENSISPALSITNHGIEIQNPHSIFTEGYRESYEQKGMGLGLEIVSLLCYQYNITTSVSSKDNFTTFSYRFNTNNNKAFK